jgi:hypothetical protein
MIDFEPLPPGSYSNWRPHSPIASLEPFGARRSTSTGSQDNVTWHTDKSSPPTSFDSASQLSNKSDPLPPLPIQPLPPPTVHEPTSPSSALPYLQPRIRQPDTSSDDDLDLTELDAVPYPPPPVPSKGSPPYSSWPRRRLSRPRVDQLWSGSDGLRSPSAGDGFSTYRPPSPSSPSASLSPSPRFRASEDSYAMTPRSPYPPADKGGWDEATLRKTLSRPLASDVYMDNESVREVMSAATASRYPPPPPLSPPIAGRNAKGLRLSPASLYSSSRSSLGPTSPKAAFSPRAAVSAIDLASFPTATYPDPRSPVSYTHSTTPTTSATMTPATSTHRSPTRSSSTGTSPRLAHRARRLAGKLLQSTSSASTPSTPQKSPRGVGHHVASAFELARSRTSFVLERPRAKSFSKDSKDYSFSSLDANNNADLPPLPKTPGTTPGVWPPVEDEPGRPSVTSYSDAAAAAGGGGLSPAAAKELLPPSRPPSRTTAVLELEALLGKHKDEEKRAWKGIVARVAVSSPSPTPGSTPVFATAASSSDEGGGISPSSPPKSKSASRRHRGGGGGSDGSGRSGTSGGGGGGPPAPPPTPSIASSSRESDDRPSSRTTSVSSG